MSRTHTPAIVLVFLPLWFYNNKPVAAENCIDFRVFSPLEIALCFPGFHDMSLKLCYNFCGPVFVLLLKMSKPGFQHLP